MSSVSIIFVYTSYLPLIDREFDHLGDPRYFWGTLEVPSMVNRILVSDLLSRIPHDSILGTKLDDSILSLNGFMVPLHPIISGIIAEDCYVLIGDLFRSDVFNQLILPCAFQDPVEAISRSNS